MTQIKRTFKWIASPEKLKTRKNLLRLVGLAVLSLLSFSLKGFLDHYKSNETFSDISEWVFFLLPYWVSAPLKSDPVLPPAIALLVLMLTIAGIILISMTIDGFKNSKKSPLPLAKFCHPDPEALKILEAQGATPADFAVCGPIIEICRSKKIYTDLSISGWDCHPSNETSDVFVRHKSSAAFLHEGLSEDEPSVEDFEHNGKKYSLVETPANFLDSEGSLVLCVQDTDYRSVQAVQKRIRNDPLFAIHNGSIFPEIQKQANSLCLHLLVQLADGKILCMQRMSSTSYAKNKMSVSCEEQLAFEDMCVEKPDIMGHWFKRALCEEIFPLGAIQPAQLEMNWKKIEPIVSDMRVLSIVYESNYINYAIVGYCRIDCTSEEFREKYQEMSENSTGRDKEGIPCLLTEGQALEFVVNGKSRATTLWGGDQIEFGEGTECPAHPSSLYRLVLFLTASGALPGQVGKEIAQRIASEQRLEVLQDELNRLLRHEKSS